MKLADWLKQKDIQRNVFADRIGVTPQAITGYCDGTFWPRKKVAKKIFKETGGAVTPTDFMQTEAAQ